MSTIHKMVIDSTDTIFNIIALSYVLQTTSISVRLPNVSQDNI